MGFSFSTTATATTTATKVFYVMGIHRYLIFLRLFFIFLFFSQNFCSAVDTITPTQSITDSQTITSSGQIFKLGFFTPGNSKNRYVGIWYNKIPVQTIVWVANRDNPLPDASGVVKVSDDGNLVVLDGDLKVLWSTNVSNIISNSTSAELLDSGNLVLRETSSNSSSSSSNNQGRILWQSFENPSDTFLPEMKFGTNLRTGKKQILRAWRGDSDPSAGKFTVEIEPLSIPQIITLNGSRRSWRSGPWNNRIFIGIPTMYSVYLDGFNLNRDDPEGDVYLTLSYVDKSIIPRYVLDNNGTLTEWRWIEEEKKWQEAWLAPENECDVYGKCGNFGSCNKLNSPICSCLRGFEPKVTDEWSKGNWSSGCLRRTELKCERNSTNGEADGFLKIERVKVPDNVSWHEAEGLKECEFTCLTNCSCSAYSYESNIGCMSWSGNLIDIQKFARAGVDLHIRVANSELDEKKDANMTIIITTVLIGIVIISVCIYFSWRWMAKHRGRKKKNSKILLFNVESPYSESSDPNMLGDNPDLKIFNFEKIIIATENFSESNKLGQGGFGSVYKGELPDGQLIAVKRLSKSSGQGSHEFKNEVVVISKLQHRNLVRLLGCCIAGEEKILIYEYMPNNSLDTYLFGSDPTKRGLLDWRKRFQIIEGISRGILYLHRDSRLKVIHRDLKASNVLLDEELNPKISDFGMARIFGSNEFEANTNRVVGTYGYMSPEYAMEGQFSEKSDVFSFGVLLLEIVSGRKNTSFYNDDQSLSLLKYAWLLWNENKIQSLIESTLSKQPVFELEIVRCIHVGLLCVQEFANDRPTMSTTLSMLTSEIATLPTPKQPAFTQRHASSSRSSSHEHKTVSINTVTLTSVGGR